MTSATVDNDTHGGSDHESDDGHVVPNYDDINTPVIVMVGVISIIVTVCTIFFVQGLTYHWQNGFIRERSYDFVNEPVREIVESQKSMLQGDAEKGIKPIDETMKEVISKYGSK